jgi:hypothetical protein
MDTEKLFARQSRGFERFIGLIAGATGAVLLLFSAVGALRSLGNTMTAGLATVLGISGALGLLLVSAGVRLIWSRRRSDGGLFSPWVLRLGGIIFFFAPIAMITNRQYFHLIEAGVCVSAGVACFALANLRTERLPSYN